MKGEIFEIVILLFIFFTFSVILYSTDEIKQKVSTLENKIITLEKKHDMSRRGHSCPCYGYDYKNEIKTAHN